MFHPHVTDSEVDLFVSGRLKGQAFQGFLRQVRRCDTCRRKLAPFLPLLDLDEPVPPPEVDAEGWPQYDAAIDRALAGVTRHAAQWAEEKAELARLQARLRERPADEPLDALDDLAEETHGWAWIECMLAAGYELRYREPKRMLLHFLGLARAVRSLCEAEESRGRYSPAQVIDLRVRALAELANAQRLTHCYADAEKTLNEAGELLLEEGATDPLVEGRFFDVYASLLMDQRKLGEALDILHGLHRDYLAVGETHLAGRALIKKGITLRRDDRPREAVEVFRQALALIDPQQDQGLVATGQQALLDALVDTGDYHEASELHLRSGLGKAFTAEPLNRLKLRWVEAKIFAGLGKLRRAEKILSEVRDEFVARDREYLAAMVDLELAGVLLRQSKTEQAQATAAEALEIFKDLKVSREAERAVRYLRDACRQGAATVDLVKQVVAFLNRLEHQPGLRFAL